MTTSLVKRRLDKKESQLRIYNSYNEDRSSLAKLSGKTVRVSGWVKIKSYHPTKQQVHIVIKKPLINDAIKLHHLHAIVPTSDEKSMRALKKGYYGRQLVTLKARVEPYKRVNNDHSYGITAVRSVQLLTAYKAEKEAE